MITKICMKNVASFKDPTTMETDKKTTLIYGLNGTGKSTLSGFLYNITDPRYSECSVEGLLDTDKLLVYNQQFIQDNFYETDDIHGIFTLSKENKAIKKVIEDANSVIRELLSQKEKLKAQADDLQDKYEKQVGNYQEKVWKIKTDFTGGDRVLEFCLEGLKGKKDTLLQYIVSLEMPTENPNYTVDDLKEEALQLQENVKKENNILKLQFSGEDIEKSPLLEKVIVGSKQSTVSGLIDKLKNSDWVNEGLQYIHMENGQAFCPFCQQPTITEKLLGEIKGYFDVSYQTDKDELGRLLKLYEDSIANVQLSIDHYKQNKFAVKFAATLEEYQAEFTKITTENIHRLQEKIKTPSGVISLMSSDGIISKINAVVEEINVEINKYNQKIENKQKSLNEIKENFWKRMRYDYASVISLYVSERKDYIAANSVIQNNQDQNQRNILDQQKIARENSKKTVNIDEAVENIKQGLIDIGISDFTIEKHSEDEALYHLNRENCTTNIFKTLSEGEKMVISFLYFIELCKGEKNIGSNSTEKIVVIDDPISSLSHLYIFNIGRLIHTEFLRTKNYNQIFILTHSLYFFYELTCIKHAERKEKQKLIRLCKNNEGSSFTEMKYDEIQNDYQAYWHIIKDETQHPALIANCMRNVIEYFFNFVEKQDFAQIFQRSELQETKFAAFNRYMNRESHSKGQNIFDIKEFDYVSFKEAFRLVFELEGYERHYKNMME
ncbi:AAA family ATPase [Eubacterium limosum]|uniref:AAA family ATPase n=1 Tax=Eubacterium limosum TaxID=1736 RepID=UPI0022E7BC02|nr:AAA family ATPase [Eubacterium limosum]